MFALKSGVYLPRIVRLAWEGVVANFWCGYQLCFVVVVGGRCFGRGFRVDLQVNRDFVTGAAGQLIAVDRHFRIGREGLGVEVLVKGDGTRGCRGCLRDKVEVGSNFPEKIRKIRKTETDRWRHHFGPLSGSLISQSRYRILGIRKGIRKVAEFFILRA